MIPGVDCAASSSCWPNAWRIGYAKGQRRCPLAFMLGVPRSFYRKMTVGQTSLCRSLSSSLRSAEQVKLLPDSVNVPVSQP